MFVCMNVEAKLLAGSLPVVQIVWARTLVHTLFVVALFGFTSPLLVAALAGPVLGERVDLKHWVAIALGFAGALIVIRPAGGATNPYLFLVVANSACYAA